MLREVKNREEWNELILKNSPRSGGFLGSWEWGEFQKHVGRPVRRFADGNQWAQVIEHALPFGKKYWYVPRGSSVKNLRTIAAQEGALFLRYESLTQEGVEGGSVRTLHISPPTTLIIDLIKSEDELLAAMHEKTRYNIRLAERKNVKCQSSNVKCFDVFWNLLQETARRDGFRMHPRSYYETMFNVLGSSNSPEIRCSGFLESGAFASCSVEFWTAEWDGKILAAGLWCFFGDTVTYLHGASSSEHRNVMAPYLLHWQVMRDAGRRGLKYYDFWGIASQSTPYTLPPNERAQSGVHSQIVERGREATSEAKLHPTPSWSGMTRFKLGFGGEVVEYPGTFDLPLSKFWYSIYKLARKIRRL